MLAATALAVAPTVARAQAPQTKSCKDGTNSTRSTFACWGHGGVDTSHASPPAEAKRHDAEPVQAGEPRAKHPKSTVHKSSKATVHHAKAEHHETHTAKKKQDVGRRGWLPWHHKKAAEQDAKKPKPKATKHTSSSRAPLTERPNGKPRQP
jgi:hypothetical protein